MSTKYIPFDDNYRVPVDVRVSCGVVRDAQLFTCGQMDLDASGAPRNIGNLSAQTERALELLFNVLHKADMTPDDALQIHIFYRPEMDETRYRSQIVEAFPACANALLTLTPVVSYPSRGAEVEIDAIVVKDCDKKLHSPRGQVRAIHAGRWGFAGNEHNSDGDLDCQIHRATTSVRHALDAVDVDINDTVRINAYFAANTSPEQIRQAEQILSSDWRDVQTTYHGVQLPCGLPGDELVRLEVMTLSGANRRHWNPQWQWPHALHFVGGLRVDDVVVIGAQHSLDANGSVLDRDNLGAQTHRVMRSLQTGLQALGTDFDTMAKVNAYWIGEHDMDRWTINVGTRSHYYVKPGPASTGIEVKGLSVEGLLTSVDCFSLCGNAHD